MFRKKRIKKRIKSFEFISRARESVNGMSKWQFMWIIGIFFLMSFVLAFILLGFMQPSTNLDNIENMNALLILIVIQKMMMLSVNPQQYKGQLN